MKMTDERLAILRSISVQAQRSPAESKASLRMLTSVHNALTKAGVPWTVVDRRYVGQVLTLELAPAPDAAPGFLRLLRTTLPELAFSVGVPSVRLTTGTAGHMLLEVPLPSVTATPVALSSVLPTSAAGITAKLPWGLGRSMRGDDIVVDVATAPHVLVTGATGTGKSAALTSLLASLLVACHPDECEVVLIDTKRVSLGAFSGMSLMRTAIVDTVEWAERKLRNLEAEMRFRYEEFARADVRDLDEYNEWALRNPKEEEPMRRIVIVIDEVADLFMSDRRKEIETTLITLAQMSRAAGLHLVCATQRPVAAVLSTQLRSQLPTRVAFAVSSAADSRIGLDEAGAEKLFGRGDGLLKSTSHPSTRFQGSWLSHDETEALVWETYEFYGRRSWHDDSVNVPETDAEWERFYGVSTNGEGVTPESDGTGAVAAREPRMVFRAALFLVLTYAFFRLAGVLFG